MATMSTYLDARRRSDLANDPDYGPYTGHPMDPRTEPDEEADELVARLDEAENCLRMARQALAMAKPEQSLQAVRSLMTEARGWLEFDDA